MARRRFFVPEVHSGQAELAGDEAKHLTQVLRVETGQLYEISDNQRVYLAEVETARKSHVAFRILETYPAPEPMTPLTVLLAVIKFERLEDAIEKATELGATEIRLIKAERSERGLDQAVPKRIQRWNRIALEASQQCRRWQLPEITGPVPLKKALEFEADYRLFLDEERTGKPLLSVLTRGPQPAAILVGPEGGWPDHEREAILAAGWTPTSLGPLVLRAETAVMAALAGLNAAFLRDMKVTDSEKRT